MIVELSYLSLNAQCLAGSCPEIYEVKIVNEHENSMCAHELTHAFVEVN